jgi:hypothetical protein
MGLGFHRHGMASGYWFDCIWYEAAQSMGKQGHGGANQGHGRGHTRVVIAWNTDSPEGIWRSMHVYSGAEMVFGWSRSGCTFWFRDRRADASYWTGGPGRLLGVIDIFSLRLVFCPPRYNKHCLVSVKYLLSVLSTSSWHTIWGGLVRSSLSDTSLFTGLVKPLST